MVLCNFFRKGCVWVLQSGAQVWSVEGCAWTMVTNAEPVCEAFIRVEVNLSSGCSCKNRANGSGHIGVHGVCTSMGSGELSAGPLTCTGEALVCVLTSWARKTATILTSVEQLADWPGS